MSALVHAIPEVESRTSRRVMVIGGLAVVCRLRVPHRATTDLDTVSRRAAEQMPQLELLAGFSSVERVGPVGVLIPTPAGRVRVDVLEISEDEIAHPPDEPSGRLYVMSHAWASETSTPVTIRADNSADINVLVAEPGPLVAMKLQSLPDRTIAKEATDLFDIVRLVLDRETGAVVRQQLSAADVQLKADTAFHVDRWFDVTLARSFRLLRRIPEAADLNRDDLELVGELLSRTLAI